MPPTNAPKKPNWYATFTRYRTELVVGFALGWHDGRHLGIKGVNLTLNLGILGCHFAYRRWPNAD